MSEKLNTATSLSFLTLISSHASCWLIQLDARGQKSLRQKTGWGGVKSDSGGAKRFSA